SSTNDEGSFNGYASSNNSRSYGARGFCNSNQQRRVIFLQHCLFCSSADFVLNEPDQAIAFILSDLGWDVWLGNYRGNRYSRSHLNLDPDDDLDYWNFSWDMMGRYDLPAMIQFVMHTTQVEQIDYIGHSMGTMGFWAMMHFHPHLSSWIRIMVGLAPVSYANHMRGTLTMSSLIYALDAPLTKVGIGEFLPSGMWTANLATKLCRPDSPARKFCDELLESFIGQGRYVDPEFLPVILAHNPAGTSLHTVSHFGQLIQSRDFEAYDHGRRRNLVEYGTTKPPKFDFSRVMLPVALYSAMNDPISAAKDVDRLARELPWLVVNHRVELDYNHMDFLWAENANTIVFSHVIDTINGFTC
ncbi:unnamed protein product, partial [Meganyctiphanes norvegica]